MIFSAKVGAVNSKNASAYNMKKKVVAKRSNYLPSVMTGKRKAKRTIALRKIK